MKKIFTVFVIFCVSLLFCMGCNKPEPRTKSTPNIILIMSDDMGYSDIGCYGGEVETPNLDALAQNGLRFTQFYNGARCCPTRAILIITGLPSNDCLIIVFSAVA